MLEAVLDAKTVLLAALGALAACFVGVWIRAVRRADRKDKRFFEVR